MTEITISRVREQLAGPPPRRVEIRPPLMGAAVALVLVQDNERGLEILFIKRAERAGDPWSGQMALPGGRWEPGDENLLATATRETREETAIGLSRATLLGALDDLSPGSPQLPPVVVRPFVFGLVERPVIAPSHEVALHLWVPLAHLTSSLVTAPVRIRGHELMREGYQVGPHFVWGITERIVTPFLERVGG